MRYSIIISLLVLLSCNQEEQAFSILDSDRTGISFSNDIPESDVFNILSFEYIYNGGGVGTADFNNDGLADLFFSGNAVESKLYLNKGDFRFQDISESSGIGANGKWCTGVSIVDINDDEKPDIYVSVNSFNTNEVPSNLLYVHQGLDEEGLPFFKELAGEYGVRGGKHTMHAGFLDYDLDGDLDLYLLNNVLDLMSPTDYRAKQVDGNAPHSDQLLRNNGDGSFTEVTKEAGILIEGYGLGLTITDLNKDGYPDVYIANDYVTNDILYINQRDGTFRNEISARLKKQSKFSMGSASNDLNNDGHSELFVLDMLAYNNGRLKKLNSQSQYNNVLNNKKYGYEEQNIRNMLHLNQGDGTFTEIAYQAGLHASDWSWTPLCADFDNDGDIDIYITNGFPKDVTDLDFINFKANRNMSMDRSSILNEIPEVKLPNQFFVNEGKMRFTESGETSGLGEPSFSNGAIAVDLDNDGDLDIITSNINQEAYVIQNKSATRTSLKVEFQSSSLIGSKVYYYHGDTVQYREYYPHQSYLSSAPPYLYFASKSHADSVRIIYPDSRSEVMYDAGKKATLAIKKMKGKPYKYMPYTSAETLMDTLDDKNMRPYFDASIQTTILTDYSHDLPQFIERSAGSHTILDGKPVQVGTQTILNVTNGAELSENSYILTTASYRNSSSGQTLFTIRDGEIISSALDTVEGQFQVVKAADYNKDGLMDLFLGGGYKYGQYPQHHPHYIATQKEGLSFTLEKVEHGQAILDAEWADVDGDGYEELLLTGHWQGLSFLENKKGGLSFTALELDAGVPAGLYYEIETQDYNEDGKADIVLGNFGNNTQFRGGPIHMISEDYDDNGTMDPLVFFRYGKDTTLIPLDLRDEVLTQVPVFKKKYTDYTKFAEASIDSFRTDNSMHHRATELRSLLLLSTAGGYKQVPFPSSVQQAPVLVAEMLGDTLFLGGNISYGREFWGSYNSSDGHWFQWKSGKLVDISDGFPRIPGDIRSAISQDGRIKIGRNGDEILVIE